MPFARTQQQTDFIDALINTTSNIALVARAGCGKTTTILEAVSDYVARFPAHEILICCFGKAIQREIEAKLKARGHVNWRQVQASTSHAMGWGLVRFTFRLSNDNINDYKVRDLIREQNDPIFRTYEGPISDLVRFAKMDGFGFFDDVPIGDLHAWYRMADHYNVNSFDDTSELDAVIEAAIKIYRISLERTDVVDFNDMILFPLIKNLRVKFGKDHIFVDEAQDTSRARRALIRKFVKPGGRITIVGDDRQAIMGFAGASVDALTAMSKELRAVTLPLNVTWRCPKAVVALAQTLVPDIEAAPEAPEGEVIKLDGLPEELRPTDAVLCRNTAPLITTAYGLIKRGIACKVEGRDIGVGLLRVVDRWKSIKTISAFLDKLEDYRHRECQKALAKGKDSKVQVINDLCDTLVAICDAVKLKGQHNVSNVRDFINDLFSDDVTAQGMLTLCTYHRSKGREWPRVMLLEHAKRCPSPWAKKDWELLQEDNLAYVAYTRAQHTLAFIG